MSRRVGLSLLLLMLAPLLIVPSLITHLSANPGIIVKTWGGTKDDAGRGVAVDISGNIYVTGDTKSFGFGAPNNSSLVLLKYNSTGDLQWRRVWGGNGTSRGSGNGEIGFAVAVGTTGDIYVTGRTESFSPDIMDGILLKFAPNGTLLWQRTWGGIHWDEGDGVAVDPSGNVYVTGYTASFGAGGADVVLLKFASNGTLLQEVTWGGGGDDEGVGVAVDIAGMVYVTGKTSSFSANFEGFLLKFDPSLSLVLQEIWGSPGLTYEGRRLGLDAAGNIYLVGNEGPPITGNIQTLILKFDPSGNPLWERSWYFNYSSFGLGIDVNETGNIYITGSIPFFLSGDAFILNLDTSGSLLWQATFTSNGGADYGGGISRDASGNPIVAGTVGAGPPYTLGSGNNTLGTPAFSPSKVDIVLGTPGFVLGTPLPSALSAPTGSETYAGNSDIFLLLFGERATITFHMMPSTAGRIVFNHTNYNSGQTYMEGQSGNYPLGDAIATAIPFSGVRFSGWSVTGGVTVSNATSNPTNVTINGSGSLTARFTSLGTPISPPSLLISSIVALAIPMWIRRKRSNER